MNLVHISESLGPVVRVLERLKVPHYLGGSVASSARGIARATLDVDVVADLDLAHVDPMAEALRPGYYLDDGAMREAVRDRSSFNLIHLETIVKIDVFLPKDRDYDRAAMSRATPDTLGEDAPSFRIASPEDIILSKLEWYRAGGGVSKRQWRDVMGVIAVQGDRLDKQYLRKWAVSLGIDDLLYRALSNEDA